jgi:HAD superfamily hydrolase (TIGR01549 family)
MQPKAVTFDIGGVIYSDDVFKRAILGALEEMVGQIDHAHFEAIYTAHLKSQSGSLRSKLCEEFLGSLDQRDELMKRATNLWKFAESDLYEDAKNCLIEIKKSGCAIAIIANQAATVVDSLKRDGIAQYIDFMGVSALVGIEKPNPEIFIKALKALQVEPVNTIHIGNRLDTDVLPAQSLGMRTAWILRGEANPDPSESDLKIPDIVAQSLIEIPQAVASLI